MTGTRGTTGLASTRSSLRRSRARNWRRRNSYGMPVVGGENVLAGSGRGGQGGSTSSVLPSWYPRTPPRDITAVVSTILAIS
ncbi:UV-B-insensitive 4-like protein [Actinidia rufa]|uniref:UV-B-insensitive 4-like protein n=1 Tax=Actinidia rufa TaxID=165716 RepID=A0A7J0FI84_9ERIC|nr:UV-B-insensitive 4-like protein [Actinidia rufa]